MEGEKEKKDSKELANVVHTIKEAILLAVLEWLKNLFSSDIMIVFCIAFLGYALGSVTIKGLSLGNCSGETVKDKSVFAIVFRKTFLDIFVFSKNRRRYLVAIDSKNTEFRQYICGRRLSGSTFTNESVNHFISSLRH